MDAVLAKFSTEELRYACNIGDVDVVRKCVDRGAEIEPKKRGRFDKARKILRNHIRYFAYEYLSVWERQLLLKIIGARESWCAPEDFAPLIRACRKGHLEVVELLLERGASHQITDSSSGTPLHIACASGHSHIARRLLQVDTDVNHQCTDGSTPLLAAAASAHVDCVRALLEHGAAPDVPDSSGWTALRCVAGRHKGKRYIQRNVDIARMLLAHGADIDMRPSRAQADHRWTTWPSPTRFFAGGLYSYSMFDDEADAWFDKTATPLQRVRRYRVPAMMELFDDYLLHYYVLRIRLYVVGPSPRRAAPRRGFFGRPVAQRPDVGGVRRGLVDEPHLARHIASFLVTTAWTDSKPHPVRPERITLESFLADRRRNRRFVDRFRLELWQQDLLCLLLYVIFLLAAYSPSKLVAGEFPYKVNSATAIYFSLLIAYLFSRMVG